MNSAFARPVDMITVPHLVSLRANKDSPVKSTREVAA